MSEKKAMIFQVPATITKDRSLSGGGRQFIIETQENMSPEDLKRLISLENKLGWFTYNVHLIEAEDIIDLPPLKKKDKDEKTEAQRLRAVFYLMWKKNSQGYKDSDSYYKFMMEKLIEHYKKYLDE